MIGSEQGQIFFNAELVVRLKQRDPIAWTQFVFYFTPILDAKLRYEFSDPGAIEDVKHTTFCRVIHLVDRDQVREPERFGSFVRGVCSKIVQEYRRQLRRTESLNDDVVETPDSRPSIENLVQDKELKRIVKEELVKLSKKDRDLITEDLEGRSRQDMARERGVTVKGLNTRICRAMKHYREQVLQAVSTRK